MVCCSTTIQCLSLFIASCLPFCLYIVIVIYDVEQLHVSVSDSVCPLGTFSCDVTGNSSSDDSNVVCIEQQFWCDGVANCPNGEDEQILDCLEREQSAYAYVFEAKCSQHLNRTRIACQLQSYPTVCGCKFSVVDCSNRKLQEFPDGFNETSNALNLADNSILQISSRNLSAVPQLNLLDLSGNGLMELDTGVFDATTQLQILRVSSNKLNSIHSGAFRGLRSLALLYLDNNELRHLTPGAFDDLVSLCFLSLERNRLTLIYPEFLPNAAIIELSSNLISHLTDVVFSKLANVQIIDLSNNTIDTIDYRTFHHTTQLIDINLASNRLSQFPHELVSIGAKTSHHRLLSLANNPIMYISENSFIGFEQLLTLNLSGLKLKDLSQNLFKPLTELDVIEFDSFELCRYAPAVRICYPRGDGISSIANLLDIVLLRVFIWLVAITTCAGNVFVMVCRLLFREEKNVHSLFIKNLATADLMMGVYLLLIGTHDILYRNQYNRHALTWMESWSCQATGFLAMLSSEASVLLLVTMSIECCIAISCPYRSPVLTMRRGAAAIFGIWTIGATLAIFPLSFGKFYSSNGVCLPLHIHDPFLPGWLYSAIVFLGVNLSAVVVIATCYVLMALSVRKTRQDSRCDVVDDVVLQGILGNTMEQSCSMAKRFFIIVATDMLCWIPIGIIKILAFAGFQISDQLYAWLTVFVLPINSALNPLIYTFTTPSFRRKFHDHFISRLKISNICRLSNNGCLSLLYVFRERRRRHSSKTTMTTTSVVLVLHDNIATHRTSATCAEQQQQQQKLPAQKTGSAGTLSNGEQWVLLEEVQKVRHVYDVEDKDVMIVG